MSSWAGHIADRECARKSNGSAIMANTILGLGTSDITSLAVAKAAADAATVATSRSVCDWVIGQQCSRGFQIASNLNGTFGSTFVALEDSLPSSAGHTRQMITG